MDGREDAYLALGADTVGGINPDVLGDDRASLWELEVFLELFFVSEWSPPAGEQRLTLAVFER